jgi:hypothetical protein
VVVDLRRGLDRRQVSDRRLEIERRSGQDRRHVSLGNLHRCEVMTADGERCKRRALVLGTGGQGWICLEHLVTPHRMRDSPLTERELRNVN